MKNQISSSLSSEVWQAEGRLLISARRRFPKPTNHSRNLQIFMKVKVLWRFLLTGFPKYGIWNKIYSENYNFYPLCHFFEKHVIYCIIYCSRFNRQRHLLFYSWTKSFYTEVQLPSSNKLPWIFVSFLCLYLYLFHWIITCRPLHLCLEWKYQNFAYGLLVWETWIVLFEMISTAWKISSFFAFWFVYKFCLGCPYKNKSYARQESLTLYQSVQLCHQVLLGPSSHFLAPSWNASSL